MIVNGIIAEYNPFHNGHKYLLEESKNAVGADYTVVVMSGNFMQRGTPALINKYKRTEMALLNGADLVLELPMYYAASSAEYFAMGGISLLDKLGVVNTLSFGSECGDLSILQKVAAILQQEPETYTTALRQYLRQGQSYPAARTNALLVHDSSLEESIDLLSSPNNILGMEYLKALLRRNSSIEPHTILRSGSGYHDRAITGVQCSARAIRRTVFEKPEHILPAEKDALAKSLSGQMPESALGILLSCIKQGTFLSANDFSAILHYKLLSEKATGFAQYLDVTPDLSDRICKNLYAYNGFEDFCDTIKSKDMTHTRISRCLLHILLNMTTETMHFYQNMDYTSYARVLGFRKDATPLMNTIKKNAGIPLVTKLADAGQYLPAEALAMLEDDISKNNIYESVLSLKSGQPMQNEYRTPIVII